MIMHFALLRECDSPQALRQSGSGAGDRGAMKAHDCGIEKGGNVVTPSSLRFFKLYTTLYTLSATEQNVFGIWATRISTWFLS